jgi:small-conductance mechanosensitive channel
MQNEVLKNIYKKFSEEKIEIPFPQRVIAINK